ncbi:MAG TPA: hypothetical protein VN703_02650 [Candidatus Sulfopaludibacter sp.]|jgi:hypothetical protein|nr:hypothetical protein [Candidatus Sulfopaludibacter sp.]
MFSITMEGLGVEPVTCIHGFISNILSVIGAASFADFKEKISGYFRTKRFNPNIRNYLLRKV